MTPNGCQKTFAATTNVPLQLDSSPKFKTTDMKTGQLSLEMC